MKRHVKANRRQPSLESLESRALLAGSSGSTLSMVSPIQETSLFVRFASDASASVQRLTLKSLDATVEVSYPDGPELIKLGKGIAPASAIRSLEANKEVLYAAADSTIHASSVAFTPNDPSYSQQWGLNNPDNVDLDAPQAWGVTVGSPSVVVAVLDTGIDLNNPDFAGKIWTNPTNDAAAGYPNDTHGWNFVADDNSVQDDDGHGTHVSAIIAAQGNNNYGVVGVAPGVQIMPLKFLDADGNGTLDDAVAAIYFAVNKGAKVINASWGGMDYSGPLEDAIAYANAHNVVFVTAAGNDGTDNDDVPSYPASYRQPNEISVAAIDQNGNLASFSNDGAGTVDVGAPGVNIISDVPKRIDPSGLEVLSGTSMSTAYVTGVVALVDSVDPNLTAAQVVERIDATAKPLPSLAGRTISGGMVDAANAVTASGVTGLGSTTPTAGIPSFVPGTETDSQVHAAILASDEDFEVHGGTATGFITGLFQDVLDRNPDSAGLEQWVATYNSGTLTRYQIVDDFLASPEGRLTEVAQWFQTDLGRTESIATLKAEPGVAAWASLLVQGGGENTVQAEIMSSSEYLIEHGSSPTTVVQGYFTDLTDRPADPAGDAEWANYLRGGLSPDTVVRMFQGAPEVEETLVATWFVQDLGRASTIAALKADPGIQAWASDLENV